MKIPTMLVVIFPVVSEEKRRLKTESIIFDTFGIFVSFVYFTILYNTITYVYI